MSAVKSMTSTTSAASLGLGDLAGQSGQVQQAQKPSRSEIPPQDGSCLVKKLSRDLIACVGNFLKVSDIGSARCTCKQLQVGLGHSKLWNAFSRDMRIADRDNHQTSVVGGRLPRSPSDLIRKYCYETHTGTIVVVRCAEDGSEHALSTCSVDDCSTLTVLQHLDSANKVHVRELRAHGGGLVTVELNPPATERGFPGKTTLGVWDISARKMIDCVEIAENHEYLETVQIDSARKSLFVAAVSEGRRPVLQLFDLTALGGVLKPAPLKPTQRLVLRAEDYHMIGMPDEGFCFDFSQNIVWGRCSINDRLFQIKFPSGDQAVCLSFNQGNLDGSTFLQKEGVFFQRCCSEIVKHRIWAPGKTNRYTITGHDHFATDINEMTRIKVDEVSRRVFAAIKVDPRGTRKGSLCRIAAWDVDTGKQLTSLLFAFPTYNWFLHFCFDMMAQAPLFLVSNSGDAGVYIFDLKGNILQQIERSFPSSHMKEYSTNTAYMRTQFVLDKQRQKLIVSSEEAGIDMPGGFARVNWSGILRVIDYGPHGEQTSSSSSSSGEPPSKRARTEEHKDSKDSKDEKRNG